MVFFFSRVASALALLGGSLSLIWPLFFIIHEASFDGAAVFGLFGVLPVIAITVAARHLYSSRRERWLSSKSFVPVPEWVTVVAMMGMFFLIFSVVYVVMKNLEF